MQTPAHCAELLQHQLALAHGAFLVAVPIPAEFEELARPIQEAVNQAVQESEANGMVARGKEVTAMAVGSCCTAYARCFRW